MTMMTGNFLRDHPKAQVSDWKLLSTCRMRRFYSGVVLKFKTSDSGPLSYQYAMGILYDGARQLSFVDLEGRTWGFGKSLLPEESNYDNEPYTVSVKWLRSNLDCIGNVNDIRDVWYSENVLPIPVVFR